MKTLDLNEGSLEATDESLTEVAVAETGVRVYPAQSVLLAMYGGWEQIGRTAILAVPAAVNQAISVLEAGPQLEPRYLLLALQHGRPRWSRYAASTRKDPNITKSDVLAFSIRVPPLPVQQEIVRVIDSAAELERGIEASIAKLVSVREGFAYRVSATLSSGPMGRVVDYFDFGAGITIGPDRRPQNETRAYLRVANVQRGRLDLSDVAHVEEFSDDDARYALHAGDLLVVEGHANPREIGRCAMVPKAASGYLHQNHLFRLRSERYLPRFSEFWLNSEPVRAFWSRIAATSSGLYTISRRALESVPFPLVGREKQEDVLAELGSIEQQVRVEERELAKLRKVREGLVDDLLSGRVAVSAVAA